MCLYVRLRDTQQQNNKVLTLSEEQKPRQRFVSMVMRQYVCFNMVPLHFTPVLERPEKTSKRKYLSVFYFLLESKTHCGSFLCQLFVFMKSVWCMCCMVPDSCGEERAEPEGKSLNLAVDLCSNPHLCS